MGKAGTAVRSGKMVAILVGAALVLAVTHWYAGMKGRAAAIIEHVEQESSANLPEAVELVKDYRADPERFRKKFAAVYEEKLKVLSARVESTVIPEQKDPGVAKRMEETVQKAKDLIERLKDAPPIAKAK